MQRYQIPLAALALALLAACQPPQPGTPSATAATILNITPAPTFDVDATATSYALQMIPSPTPAGLYVVRQGDTLGALAQDFGTTVDDIMAANGITDADAIQVGQTLIIPSLVDRPLPTASSLGPTDTSTPVPPTDTPTVAPTRPKPTAAPPTEPPAVPTPTAEPPTITPPPVSLDEPTATPAP